MAWGIQSYGTGSYGGSDFVVTDHFPIDNSVGNNRLATISFTLLSQSGSVTLSSIDLIANGIPLITSGVQTSHAIAIINNSNPNAVQVTATVTHAFAPFEVVSVVVSAVNSSAQAPVIGTTWSFVVDNVLHLFSNYIVRRFERVEKVGAVGLDAPQNPQAIVFLAPPPNLQAEVI